MPSDRRLSHLQTLDWDNITKRLLQHVQCRLGTRGTAQDAEDIAQAAIRQLLDPTYADWDPTEDPDPLRHLGSAANGLIANFVRHQASRPERHEELRERLNPTSPQTPEHILAAKQQVARVRALLLTRMANDPICQQLVQLTLDQDIRDADEQSKHIGCSPTDIYNARRRLQTHTRAVQVTLQNEERLPNAEKDPSDEVRS